jgi:hypothetical protein
MPLPTFGVTALIVTTINAGNTVIPIDVTPSQEHRFPSRITENPVDNGTVYSDHQVILPKHLTIEGRVSDSSVSLVNTFIGKMKAKDAFDALVKIQLDRIPFDVHTSLHVYSNMLLEDLLFPRAAKDGRSIRFVAVMREVQIVGSDAKTNSERIAESVRYTALPIKNNGLISKILSS